MNASNVLMYCSFLTKGGRKSNHSNCYESSWHDPKSNIERSYITRVVLQDFQTEVVLTRSSDISPKMVPAMAAMETML